MNAATPSRRAELVDRCRRERLALIAVAARKLEALPRAREAARLLGTLRRVARIALRAAL
jgi:hypothetical protein